MSLLDTINIVTNIVGGTPSTQGRFPFQAALLSNGKQFCGGSLIAPNIVLTAAHCAQQGEDATHVALGCVNITDLEQCEVIEVVNSSIFEDFEADNLLLKGDLKLLVLESDSVQTPVIIANAGFELQPGQDLTTIGWGEVSPPSDEFATEDSNGILLEVNVEAISQELCDAQYRDVLGLLGDYDYEEDNYINVSNVDVEPFGGVIVNNSQLCAAADGKDACEGDEGGPLFLRCDATKADVQVGVYSFSLGCAYDGIPGVYTSVFNPAAFQFIESVVKAEGHELATIDSISDFCVVGGTQPTEELSDPPTPFPTFDITKWTCRPQYFAAADGCDCGCGIPDPDCEFENRISVFNCEDGEICVDAICVDPKNTSAPTLSPTFAPTTPTNESDSFLSDVFSSAGGIIGVVLVLAILAGIGAAVWMKTRVNTSSSTELDNEITEKTKTDAEMKGDI